MNTVDVIVREVGLRDGLQMLQRSCRPRRSSPGSGPKRRRRAGDRGHLLRAAEARSRSSPTRRMVTGSAGGAGFDGIRADAELQGAERGFDARRAQAQLRDVGQPHPQPEERPAEREESVADFARIVEMVRSATAGPAAADRRRLSSALGCSYEGRVAGRPRSSRCAVHLARGRGRRAYGAGHGRLRRPETGAEGVPRRAGGGRRHAGRRALHDTRGLGLANVAAALECGVRRFDASLAGLGGCQFAPGATGTSSWTTCASCSTPWECRPAWTWRSWCRCARSSRDSAGHPRCRVHLLVRGCHRTTCAARAAAPASPPDRGLHH